MKKLNLFVVKPSDTREEVQKKFVEYLKKQGIKITKEGKNEKKLELMIITTLKFCQMEILNCIVMHVDPLGQMFTILRTIMVDYWNGLKEEVMAVWEKNIIYILMKNKNGRVKNNPLPSNKDFTIFQTL